MTRLKKKKLNKIEVDIVDTPAFEIDVKIKKKLSAYFGLTKILALILLFSLNFNGILAIRDTISYYSDTEDSPSNVYAAGILDFEIDSTDDFSPSPICPGNTTTKTVNFLNLANVPKYQVSATSFIGLACDYFDLTASLDGTTTYTGSLKNFISEINLFAQPDTWTFALTLNPAAPSAVQNQSCDFKFTFFGSQERNDLPFGKGFNDIEEIDNSITVCNFEKVLINKVFYDVDFVHGKDLLNEWVELYNPSSTSVDISGWKICDDYSCDTIPKSDPIPAQGFALVTDNYDTWDYWRIPGDVVKITLNNYIGNGLDNSADMLLLKNTDEMIVDQMNWGTPTSTWLNYNSGVWDPGAEVVYSGKALGRIPTAYDTDLPSDWHKLGLPYLSVTQLPHMLYCNATYTIDWLAMNQNGDDDELSIDIIYIKDSNHDGVIGFGDDTYLEAEGLANTGSYVLKIDVDKGYCGFNNVWIKVIASGPENFMLKNIVNSGPYYEPVDPEIFDPTEMCSDVPAYCSEAPETCDNIAQFCSDWQVFESQQEIALMSVNEIEQKPAAVATTTEEIIILNFDVAAPEEVVNKEEPIEENIATMIDEVIDEVFPETVEVIEVIEIIETVEEPVEELIEEVVEEILLEVIEEPVEIIENIEILETPVIEETPAIEEPVIVEPEAVVVENLEPTPSDGEI
jgi:6-pyruvoyl-tetrahydropterin synthase